MPDAPFQKTFQQLELTIAEKDLPKPNYDNITIICAPYNDSTLNTAQSICSNKSNILTCTCDQLRAATKYNISLFTNKMKWKSRELVMHNQYTGINILN